jgi:hypothetical protein
LQDLHHRLLDESIQHGWHTPVELHSGPTNLWDRLKSSTRFIPCVAGGSMY